MKKEGLKVVPEIMIPLVGHVKELRDQKTIVDRVAAETMKEQGVKIEYLVGTMIEVPRGAMTADEIAGEAQFFSFGTNDLTQTTFGFSRDDIGKFLGAYQDKKILDKDPFSTIDTVGVGSLVRIGRREGARDASRHQARHLRRARRRSRRRFTSSRRSGLNYVSMSPYRVPVARLAAAQAALSVKGRRLDADEASGSRLRASGLVGFRPGAGARSPEALWAASPSSRPISPIRSPPARLSSARHRSSRSSSKTPSTPARGASRSTSSWVASASCVSRTTAKGWSPEDARLSLERHATSKIQRADDLAAIHTLGFRGEALPSIASVSHFVMKTRLRGDIAGTEIRVNGGAVAAVQEIGMPEGTSIEVGDLFYNLPARRKFLKTDTGEATQVSRVVTQFALGYPEVGFTLTSGPRTMFNWPAVAKFDDRLYQVFGERPDLVPVGKA